MTNKIETYIWIADFFSTYENINKEVLHDEEGLIEVLIKDDYINYEQLTNDCLKYCANMFNIYPDNLNSFECSNLKELNKIIIDTINQIKNNKEASVVINYQ